MATDVSPSIVIAAGGTGGHIYPGLALADALRRLSPDTPIAFVGTRRGLETRLIPEAGWPLHLVDMIPFQRSLGMRRWLLPAALARSAVQARGILRREQASVAVGMGGYASIPLVAGARLARVPALIHESGAVGGRANRLAARLTRNVALAWDQAAASFPGARTRTVGMPLGPELDGFDRDGLREAARRRLDVPEGVQLVVVNGGSQGATRLNELGVALAARWRQRDDVRLLVKAGRAHVEPVATALAAAGGDRVGRVTAFLDRMDDAYAAADVMVCRAGAGTVAELAVTGTPAVLVPYPFAPDDHQTVNAGVLVEAGGAVLVRDEDADADGVGPLLESLLTDESRRTAMGDAARTVGRPHAADALAAWVLDLAVPR